MKKRRIIIESDEEQEQEEIQQVQQEIQQEEEKQAIKKQRNKEKNQNNLTSNNIINNFILFFQDCFNNQNNYIDILNKRQNLFEESKNLFNSENFTIISSKHLLKLFNLIDKHMFQNYLNSLLNYENHKVTFRISQRMTSRAGQLLTDLRKPNEHELAISSYLLFKTFSNQHDKLESETNERQIKVNGIECYNRLDCLLRIVEHEIIHLILCCPNLVNALQKSILKRKNNRRNNIDDFNDDNDDDSNNNNSRSNQRIGRMPDETYHGETFQLLVRVLFGHTEWTHDLITQHEIAYSLYNITVGAKVKFNFDGVQYSGQVNRVQKRVTVLVKESNKNNPHPDSREFSDGNYYRKFYVPIEHCRVIK